MIVPGDVDGCGALGVALQRAATGVGSSAQSLSSARAVTEGWAGAAGDAWRSTEARQQAAAADLAAALHAAGSALVTFAALLAEAQDLAAAARNAADAAGLALSAEGEVPWVDVPCGPYDTPQERDQAREAGRRAEARGDVLRLVAAASETERDAHEQLVRALGRIDAPSVRRPVTASAEAATAGVQPPGWNDWLDLANGLLLAPTDALDRAGEVAAARGRFAKSLKAATQTGTVAQRAVARREWRAALREMRTAQRAADLHALRQARLQPASGWLAAASRPLSRAVPVVRNVPVLSIAMTGVGTAVDVEDGMDPTHAVVKNVASTGAGMAAGTVATGAAAAVLTGGAVALAPVVVGVAVGAAVGYGVGLAVEEYGDDVVDAVGDVAGGAADLAGDVWGSLTD